MRSRAWVLTVVVATVAAVLYASALACGFVYDDRVLIEQNPWLRDWASILRIFSSPLFGFSDDPGAYYRPLQQVAYLALYQLAGPAPWAFHLANIALHCSVSALVFALIARVVPNDWAAFAAAVLFAAHPTHTEPVIWVAALSELSLAVSLLLAILMHVKWSEEGSARARVASLACYIAALLSKEPAVVLIPLLLVYDRVSGKLSWRRLVSYVPHAAVTAAYLAVRFWALSFDLVPELRARELGPGQLVLSATVLFAEYLGKLVVPWPLAMFRAFDPVAHPLEPRVIVALVGSAAFACAAAVAIVRRSVAALGLAFISLPLVPALYVPSLSATALADRYLYVPSVGLAVLVALALHHAPATWPRRAAAAAIAAAAVAYCVGTVARVGVWRDEVTLWSDGPPRGADGRAVESARSGTRGPRKVRRGRFGV